MNKPIGWIINLCYKIIPNYALALLLFAIVMKVILFPFGIKQQKNMLKQAKLRPKEQAIRKRYAGRDDQVTRQKMQEDLMKLYQDEGYNPASGCLPMILQLVIVIAVYGVMRQPVTYVSGLSKTQVKELGVEIVHLHKLGVLDEDGISNNLMSRIEKQANKVVYDGEDNLPNYEKVENPFTSNDEIEFVRIVRNNYDTLDEYGLLPDGVDRKDLPEFYLFGNTFDLSVYPTVALNWYILIPILTFVFTFGSMKLTKKFMYQSDVQQQTANAGCAGKIMDYVMPAMSTFITFSMPSIIAVYWIYNNVLSLAQQIVLKFMYPIPVFTEDDYKQAEIEMNKGVKQPKKKVNNAKRAAHRIDLDEDEVGEAPKPEPKKHEKQDPKASLITPAQIKDESDKKSDNE